MISGSSSGSERTLIIIPAYNEETSVSAVILKVEREVRDATCLVIDDGFRNSTAVTARAAVAGPGRPAPPSQPRHGRSHARRVPVRRRERLRRCCSDRRRWAA